MNALPALAPLAQAGLSVTEYAQDRLRIEAKSNAALVRVHSLVDLPRECPELDDWPKRTGRCRDGDPAVLCLGPREWLLVSETRSADAMLGNVRDAVVRSSTAVCDVSDALAIFRLTGAAAPWLLAKVCALDVHAGLPGGSWSTRARVGQVTAVVHFHGTASGTFDLVVDRSLARYLWELLTSCAPHARELATVATGMPGDRRAYSTSGAV